VEELWGGLGQISFARYLAELDTGEIVARLIRIRDTLAGKAGLIAGFTGSGEAMAAARSIAARAFRPFVPPSPRNPHCVDGDAFRALADGPGQAAATPAAGPGVTAVAPPAPEVFASPSLQIGFAALTLGAAPYNSRAQAAELVLAHQLSTGALWEDIRMKGGAYGAFAHTDSIEGIFALSTYRDPNPQRSIDSFKSVLQDMLAAPAAWYRDAETLEKAIVGTYAREIRPRTPAERGGGDFIRFLYGVDDELRLRKLQWLIEVEGEEIAEALRGLAGQEGRSPVIIAGPAAAEKAAKELGVDVKTLPV
jgi:Zn-dependent M16 (insulinase) family peptidase